MPDTPHVQPLSCELEWTNQEHFYCCLLKPIRDNLITRFPRVRPPWQSCAGELWGRDWERPLFLVTRLCSDFVRRNTHSNTDSNSQINSGPVTTATIPYIRGTSETIARISQPYNIRAAHTLLSTICRRNIELTGTLRHV